jgi:hypothetical protein
LSTLARVIFGRSLPSLYGFSSQLLMLNLALAVFMRRFLGRHHRRNDEHATRVRHPSGTLNPDT